MQGKSGEEKVGAFVDHERCTVEKEVVFVDWKGKPEDAKKHGGRRAAAFVCAAEALENMVVVSNAANLVTYFYSSMNYSLAQSANMVTNFLGTSLMLSLLGGFICDSFLKRFWTIVTFGIIELLGLSIMTIQAHFKQFHPPPHQRPSAAQAAMLYSGLYIMALGIGGVKAALPAHGGDQFPDRNKRLSNFFNWFFFSLCSGGLIAVTLIVWIQENKGWQWGFGVATGAIFLLLVVVSLGLPYYRHKIPSGSPFSRITKENTNFCRFLDKATLRDCTDDEVAETKIFLGLLPIFFSTIMMNCCLAQLSTFSIQQGHRMNTTLFHSFTIPTSSLTAIPLVFMLLSVSLYDRFFLMAAARHGLTPLKRIGLGLVLASVAMAVAAIVEVKRKARLEAPISVLWLGWQYLLLGVSDMFTLAGMMEFFYSEAPESMRSVCTAGSWCSTASGFFLSSVLVTLANALSSGLGSKEWIAGTDLNNSRLELFYTVLALLNFFNFLNYLFWARWY
ncbi:NRT1-PTR FAMILY 4-2 protein [Nymphaea thermarum]|nr:NRT1-PTR FAMILY 4-2 protein [Nymphaea thermarum]